MPVVTGLTITSSAGPEPLGVWGMPSDPPLCSGSSRPDGNGGEDPIPIQYCFLNLYPNPGIFGCSVEFALPRNSIVSVWVTRARWIGDPVNEAGLVGNSIAVAPQTLAIAELMRERTLPAGHHSVAWSGRDQRGRIAPVGFYRIFFRTGDFLAWHDFFLAHSLDDFPLGIRRTNY